MDIIGIDIQFVTNTPPTGESEYTIKFYLTDSNTTELTFVKQTDRYYAAFKNGICEHIVLKDKLENIFATVSAIK